MALLFLLLLLQLVEPSRIVQHFLRVLRPLLLDLFVLFLSKLFDLLFVVFFHLLLLNIQIAVLLLVLSSNQLDFFLKLGDLVLLVICADLLADACLRSVFNSLQLIFELVLLSFVLLHLRLHCQNLLAEFEVFNFPRQIHASWVLVLDVHDDQRTIFSCRKQEFVVVANPHPCHILAVSLDFIYFFEWELPNLHCAWFLLLTHTTEEVLSRSKNLNLGNGNFGVTVVFCVGSKVNIFVGTNNEGLEILKFRLVA